jgi:hypothetical protein
MKALLVPLVFALVVVVQANPIQNVIVLTMGIVMLILVLLPLPSIVPSSLQKTTRLTTSLAGIPRSDSACFFLSLIIIPRQIGDLDGTEFNLQDAADPSSKKV